MPKNYPNTKISVEEAQDILSAFIFENALRSADGFCDREIVGGVPVEVQIAVAFEFLVADVYFLECAIQRSSQAKYRDELIEPVCHLALIRLAQTRESHGANFWDPKPYELKLPWPKKVDINSFVERLNSTLDVYFKHEKFYRDPRQPGFKQSVVGEFGTRVARIFGESEFSLIAMHASVHLKMVASTLGESKLLDDIIDLVILQPSPSST